MSGSVYDAEDLTQETLLRAWKSSASFEGRSSVRTWLYRIATNVCLDNLESRPRRPMPTGLGAPDVLGSDPLVEDHEIPWLEPVPDAAVVVAERDSIRLAFVAALQHLPARQRAVLILRDVLRWSAAEVAEALETTTAAVNSALQRAHAQLADQALTEDTVTVDLSAEQRAMLDRYVEAFWRKDIDSIVSMLTEEAVWEMPPFVGWYRGAANIGELIANSCPGGAQDMPMLADLGQRPARVRPVHALGGRQLPPVPAAGARARRRPGPARERLLRDPAVRDVRPAGGTSGRLHPAVCGHEPAMTAGLDALAPAVELLERSLAYTRTTLASVPRDPLRWAVPTPCTHWDLAALLAHMDDALDAFNEAALGAVGMDLDRQPDATIAGIQRKACALLGAWSGSHAAVVRVGDARCRATCSPRPLRWRSRSTAGTSRRRPVIRPRSRRRSRTICCPSPHT